MSTIVVSRWVTTEAYRADLHIGDEGWQLISDTEGIIANYHGIQLEDPNVGVSVQVCTSPEAFMKVVTNKELYDKICSTLDATRVGDPEHFVAVCVSDPLKALVGPYYQVSRITLRNDTPETKATLEGMCVAQREMSDGKMTYGWDVQDPKTVHILKSWDSLEVHTEFALRPDMVEVLKALDEIAVFLDGPLRHPELIKVK